MITEAHRTQLGALYRSDCLDLLRATAPGSVDMVFADPPFNLGKDYDGADDDMAPEAYENWTRAWIAAAIPCLRPGGSLFIYNLPVWCVVSSAFLMAQGLPLQNWIAIKTANRPPISGRMYPAHYGLIWHTKGDAPKTFKRIRTPVETCRHCNRDIKDYGGHKREQHAKGITLGDVWTDIAPVCHGKYKPAARGRVNALSTKVIDRCVEMTTCAGDIVLDPFAGSGTVPSVCEKLRRRWVACDKGPCDAAIERLTRNTAHHKNMDWVESHSAPARTRDDEANDFG